eukprot:gene9146-18952_t
MILPPPRFTGVPINCQVFPPASTTTTKIPTTSVASTVTASDDTKTTDRELPPLSAPPSPVVQQVYYQPNHKIEMSIYEQYWDIVNPSGISYVSGTDIVHFFRKSELDHKVLHKIWSLSTPSGSSNMSRIQFYTALRYITILQNNSSNGYNNIPISFVTTELLQRTSFMKYPPPRFAGVPINIKEAYCPFPSKLSDALYAATSEDISKYIKLFTTFDTDKDRFITGQDAITIFSKFGLDRMTLGSIWDMSDVDKDGRLVSLAALLQYPIPAPLPPVHIKDNDVFVDLVVSRPDTVQNGVVNDDNMTDNTLSRLELRPFWGTWD